MNKINLGAGYDLIEGYINHDIAPLDGIEVIHDLNQMPWPWQSNSVSDLVAKDVIEHLDDFMAVMEEAYRILCKGGIMYLKVPYWNSWSAYADPTHKRGFHELAFRFFEPTSGWCGERGYYSKARFMISDEAFILMPFSPYFSVPGIRKIYIRNKFLKKIVSTLAGIFSGVIIDLEITMVKI
ncbi:methyltransferase domain-containing protein [Polynucleobacter sp. es-GGE-1]|uniref:class I SAM-dependent methyltransferase n=1 Tax=Polynucleobacter sp. es-GGE-1 TaxID=1819724 RepID=UPI001C0AC396|nr:methyltransferase domain-containing protein [Polynucleobacter sp. es-GGE-1]